MRNIHKRYIVLALVILVVVVIIWKVYPSFAYMDQGYEGNNIISGRSWGINITEVSNFETKGKAELVKNDTATYRVSTMANTFNINARLRDPGDSIEFDIKVTNTGKLNAELYRIVNTGLSDEFEEEVDYDVVPLDYVVEHTDEHEGSIIKPNESHMFHVTVKVRNSVAQTVDREYSLNLGSTIHYKQR